MDTTLERLQRWYAAQCDGDWEHNSGIKIETLDNPGWLVKIDLAGTALEGQSFAAVSAGMKLQPDGLLHPAKDCWHTLSLRATTFEAAGDLAKLEFLLESFLEWAERASQ